MENKYYVPTLEEFHVGFRYEFNTNVYHPGIYGWEGVELEDNELTNIQFHIEREEIRVKYLDQADLEGLGWKYIAKEQGSREFARYFKMNNYWLVYSIMTEVHQLFHVEGATHPMDVWKDNSDPLFRGKIKNYNEMKKLMQMLQIT